jgi:hypothetical protein
MRDAIFLDSGRHVSTFDQDKNAQIARDKIESAGGA